MDNQDSMNVNNTENTTPENVANNVNNTATPNTASTEGTVNQDGRSLAIASMVLGIISVAISAFGYAAIVSVVLGIVGLVLSIKSKKLGFKGGMRTAGFVCSIIGIASGAICFIACVACAAAINTVANEYDTSLTELTRYLKQF